MYLYTAHTTYCFMAVYNSSMGSERSQHADTISILSAVPVFNRHTAKAARHIIVFRLFLTHNSLNSRSTLQNNTYQVVPRTN